MTTEHSAISRRSLLQLIAAGAASSSLLPALLRASARKRDDDEHEALDARRIERIGLQLYTVRRAMGKDLDGTLAAVAAAGVTEIEPFTYYNKPAQWWRDKMKALGFTSPSAHIGMPATDEAWLPLFEMAKAVGHEWVIVPSMPGGMRGADGFKKFADRLNSGGELAKKSGLRIGFHNHNSEFAPIDGGPSGYDILLKNTDPKLVDFELDIYWAVKAGQDPFKLIAENGKRIVCVHVKDAGPAPELAMMDVGAGTIDFKAIIKAGRKAALKHWFIEHDNPTDDITSITASAAAMKQF